jgi:hypothetical protein
VRGVVSVAVLSLGSVSGAELAIETVLVVLVTLSGCSRTVTAKSLELEAPAARLPWSRLQVDPALPLGLQVHPGELAAALNVVWAGTVSVKLVAGALPRPPLAKPMA